MQYELKNLPKSEAEITVDVPFVEFEPHTKKAAEKISEKVEIDGFRKGKAPYEKIKERVGEQAIYEEAADMAVRKLYSEIFQKILAEKKEKGESFTPIGRPEITVTKLAPGNDVQFKIKLALLSSVELPDYRAIARRVKKEKKDISVTDEEVKKTLDWVWESRSPLVTVDRPAQMGDTVEINFDVSDHGVKIEGGESRNHPLVLGHGRFIPGFEENLVGMKAGNEKSFSLKAPDEWHEKNLAGKELSFGVTLNSVQERQKKELNDEFAKSLGDFATLDALRANIREGIGKEKEEKESQRIKAMIIEEVAQGTKVEIPLVLIAAEIDKMFSELKSGIESMGMKWEDYLTHIKKSPEDLRKDWGADAERRVRAALCLRTIAGKESIEVSAEEVEARANQFLGQYPTPERQIDPGELYEYARGILKNEKVFALLENS